MLIPSKLSRPVRLDHTVVRERLLAKLSGANNFRLALIHQSPAGYGKDHPHFPVGGRQKRYRLVLAG